MKLLLYDYHGNFMCHLKSSTNSDIVGEAYNEQLAEDINGRCELSFILPLYITVDGVQEENVRWAYIIAENKIKLIDDSGKIYWFKIKSPNDKHDNDGTLRSNIQCKSIVYDLNKKNVDLVIDENNTAENLVAKALKNTGWSVGTVDSFEGKSLTLKQTSASNSLNLLNEIATLFDGYLVFDTDAKTVSLHSNSNALTDYGVQFRIGKNIKSLERLRDSTSIVTRLYVSGAEDEYGVVGIQSVNPTGEPYIDNFSYYIENGMLNAQQQADIDQYDIDITNVNANITSTQNSISLEQGDRSDLTIQLNAKKISRSAKYARIDEIDEQLTVETNSTVISTLNSERSTLVSDISTLDGEISTLESDIATIDSTLSTLNTNLTTYLSDKESIKEQFYSAFSDYVHEGIYQNTNLISPQSIYDDGVKVLEGSCTPRVSYSLSIVDLSSLTGYELEKFKLGDIIGVIDPFLKITTKVKITKIERDLCNPQDATVEISNYYDNIEELLKDISKNVDIIKKQKQYWDRTQKIVQADGTLDVSKLQSTFDKGTFAMQSGTNNSISNSDQGIILSNINDSNVQVKIDGDEISSTEDNGVTWTPVLNSKGVNVQKMFGAVLDVSQVYLRGNSNFFWNGDGLFALDSANPNHWIRFNHDGIFFTLDNGATYEMSMSWNGLEIGKHSVVGLEDDLTTINDNIDTINTNVSNLETFRDVTYPSDIADLQNQIDGNITTWFYDGAPTLANNPAVNWTTDTEKDVHLGDLYYDNTTGYAYRFVNNSGYTWTKITDTDVTTALANAQTAQDTADSKRRVFVTTPTPPYDLGDLWSEGASGDIKKCIVAKTQGQSYDAGDWGLASKYTDDTVANTANTNAQNAQNDATNALNELSDIASDSKITPVEKLEAKQKWDAIVVEGNATTGTLILQADSFSVSHTDFDTAYDNLDTYLNTTIDVFSNMTTATSVTRSTWNATWNGYYNERTNLLNAISTKAKTLADDAQSSANTAITDASNAQSAADDAQTDATSALSSLSDIASDDKLTPSEKQKTKLEWDVIAAEKTQLEGQATTFGITTEKTNYTNAYNTLDTYIAPLLTDLNATSDIVGTTFRTNFKDYYDKRTLLLQAITDKAKTLADNAQAKADTSVQQDADYNNVKINPANGLVVTNQDTTQSKVNGDGVEVRGGNITIYDENDTLVMDGRGVNPLETSGWGITTGLTFDESSFTSNGYIEIQTFTSLAAGDTLPKTISVSDASQLGSSGKLYKLGSWGDFCTYNNVDTVNNTIDIISNYIYADPNEYLVASEVDSVAVPAPGGTSHLLFKAGSVVLKNGKYVKFSSDFTYDLPVSIGFTDYDGWQYRVLYVDSNGTIQQVSDGTTGDVIDEDTISKYPKNPRYNSMGNGTPDENCVVLGAVLCGSDATKPFNSYFFMHPDFRDERAVKVTTDWINSDRTKDAQVEKSIFATSTVTYGSWVKSSLPMSSGETYEIALPIGKGKRLAIVSISSMPIEYMQDNSASYGAVIHVGLQDPYNQAWQPRVSIGYGDKFIDSYCNDSYGDYIVSNSSLSWTYRRIKDAYLKIGADGEVYLHVILHQYTSSETRDIRLGWYAM